MSQMRQVIPVEPSRLLAFTHPDLSADTLEALAQRKQPFYGPK
jgi:hypothetical protein